MSWFETAHPGERTLFPDIHRIEQERKIKEKVGRLLDSLPTQYRAAAKREIDAILKLANS